MSIKRWQGMTSSAWSTLGTTFADANWLNAEGNDIASSLPVDGDDIQMLASDIKTPSVPIISISTANPAVVTVNDGHPFVPGVTNTVIISGVGGTGSDINATRSVTVSGNSITITGYNGTGKTYNLTQAQITKVPFFCAIGPSSPITINSLVITMPADSGVQLLSTNANNLTISGTVPLPLVGDESVSYNLRYTDTPAITGSSSFFSQIFGSTSSTNATILSGCHALFIVQPSNSTISTRSIMLNVPSGASLDIITLQFFDQTRLNNFVTWGSTGSTGTAVHTLGGTLTYSALSANAIDGSGTACRHQGYGVNGQLSGNCTININASSQGIHTIGDNLGLGTPTININAPSQFQDTSTGLLIGNATFNINAPSMFLGNAIKSFPFGATFNVYAPLTIARCSVLDTIPRIITGISKAANAVITLDNTSMNFYQGNTVTISGIVSGMTEINGTHTVVSQTSTSVTISTNSTAFSTWTSGGTLSREAMTLTVNTLADVEVIQGDVSGNITINNIHTVSDFRTTVVPSASVLTGNPRWTGATGVDIGTYSPTITSIPSVPYQEIQI